MGKEAHVFRLSGEKIRQNHLDESLAGKTGGKNVGTPSIVTGDHDNKLKSRSYCYKNPIINVVKFHDSCHQALFVPQLMSLAYKFWQNATIVWLEGLSSS
jgi:hypothetical protein